ncbi:MAG: PilT/PilU family type 4a pilus ATPase, partial [Nitrospiraceae bacterium]|nr:PilT/PilU family type 4a pilus ATPase [Nitrospiraceae bacterium]
MVNINLKQELDELITSTAEQGASDLHFSVGRYPTLRVDGKLLPLSNREILVPGKIEQFVGLILPDNLKERLLKDRGIDFSYDFHGKMRFRTNIFYQKGFLGIAMRLIPSEIKTLEELNLPIILEKFTRYSQGFVLIVGPTGHGKSTTLASLINSINHSRYEHIITIEDPIEYLYSQDKCIIDQREVGRDAKSFGSALRSVFREDADVIMVGEMRDAETMATAVTAAETGHLVFATLHTNNAPQTIDRIIDSFPANQQNQIRIQLAGSLLGIFSQRLLPKVKGGRVPAGEILFSNAAVRNLIREGKTHQLNLVINTSVD